MEKLAIIDIYKTNIFHVGNIMIKLKNNKIPKNFQNKFEMVQHQYSRKQSKQFHTAQIALMYTKMLASVHLFKKTIRDHLINMADIVTLIKLFTY